LKHKSIRLVPRCSRGTEQLERMRRQNKKWGWGKLFPFARVRSLLPRNRQAALILTKTDPCASRKVESVPDGHGSGARRGVGAGTLSSSKRAHTVAVAIPGQGPLAGGHHQIPHPVLFPLTAGIQFYNFSSKTQSPSWMQSRQTFF
jgi:hypothetical protein